MYISCKELYQVINAINKKLRDEKHGICYGQCHECQGY